MSQPNLLFLMTDQQRGDTLAPDSPCQMPTLQGLIAAGTRFERCYAPNPICSPTRASLLTGKLPHNHGMVDCTHTVEPYRAMLKPDLPFWSRNLHEAGYRTGYFGKWHIERSGELEHFGFDQYEVDTAGYRAHRQAQGLEPRGPALSLARRVPQPGYEDFLLYGVTDEPAESSHEHYLYSQGIAFIERAAREEAAQPWALFVSTEGPHDPYVVPRSHWERYDPAALPVPASFEDPLADRPGIYRRIQRVWEGLEWADFAEATACYYAFCSLIDDQVARILQTLEATGQLDNTLIVFTSDHGDYMGAHRLLLKGIPAFEEAYRVPLVLCGPGIPQGRTVPDVTSLMDLAASIVPLTTGGTFPAEGRSLLPLLQAEPDAAWAQEAFAEGHGQRFFFTQRLLWEGRYKYVFNGFDEDELYDLESDPHELCNLASDEALRPVLQRMAARMWEIIVETGDFNMYQSQYGMFRFAPVGPDAAVRAHHQAARP